MTSPATKAQQDSARARGLCIRCGKRPIDRDRSKSRCTPCLDYAQRFYKPKGHEGHVG